MFRLVSLLAFRDQITVFFNKGKGVHERVRVFLKVYNVVIGLVFRSSYIYIVFRINFRTCPENSSFWLVLLQMQYLLIVSKAISQLNSGELHLFN